MNNRLKSYEKYRDSGVEWLGEIPEHWEVRKLKYVCQMKYGNSLEANKRKEGKIPVYGSNGIVDFHNQAITKAPCIIIGRKGSFGKINFSDIECFPIDTTYYIDEIDRELYSLEWLMFLLVVLKLDSISKDTGVPGLNREDAYQKKLPIPPLKTQNQIVEYLNRKTEQADTFIEKQTRFIELLKEQKKAIINKAVTKGLNPDAPMKYSGIEWLGEIPAHWEVRKLKYFVKINRATLTEKTKSDFEFDYIDISSVSENGLFLKPERIKFKDAPSRARRIVKSGDTIISTVRTYLRAIEYFNDVKNHTIVSTGFAVLSPSQKVHKEYLSYLIRNEYFLNKVTANSIGIAYPAISTNIMGGFYLPIPEISEQQQIVSYIETKTAKIDQAIEKAEKEITLVKEYLQSLIYHVVTGRLKID